MSVTIASNLVVFADGSGHGNQSHLIYAANQQRWVCFNANTKTATTINSYFSPAATLTNGDTWVAGTTSGAFANSRAMSANDQRNVGVAGFTNGAVDVAHVDVGIQATSAHGFLQHVRATITGTSTVTWETWNERDSGANVTSPAVIKGNCVGVSSGGFVHGCSNAASGASTAAGVNGDPDARVSTNADTTSTWTNGFGSPVSVDDGMSFQCNSYAFAALASNAMLLVYENASVSNANSGGLKSEKYTSGTTWPNNTGSVDVGIGTSTQDENDWCMCRVDSTHIYAIRRDSSNTFKFRMHDGNTTWSTPTNLPPTQATKAGAGLFAVTDGIDLWLFVIDSDAANTVRYCKYTSSSGTWGSWTALETATKTRTSISGNPQVSNGQIGVLWMEANGSNFDLVVSALTVTVAAVNPIPQNPTYKTVLAQ